MKNKFGCKFNPTKKKDAFFKASFVFFVYFKRI